MDADFVKRMDFSDIIRGFAYNQDPRNYVVSFLTVVEFHDYYQLLVGCDSQEIVGTAICI